MATVLPKPDPATKADARLERELARTAGRIRFNDLLAGGLALAALLLGYAVAAVLLDQALELPGWVRQLGLGGFLVSVGVVGYLLVVRPLRRAINPRYTARRVEETVPDAKNAVINWVDLRETDMPDGVRTAVGRRAAEDVSAADVNKATESTRVLWLGATVGLLFATLAVLVIVFKPAPFLSLVDRAFNPFGAGTIASRTNLTLQEPENGDVTVTAGEPMTVTVLVSGSVPDADSADRVRLLVRHNPAATEYDEIPLEEGETARLWTLRVPQSVIQNGFWYKVAAGDAVTAEYRVTVRSKPLVKEVEVRYEYPAYTRLKPETATDRNIDGYRGTKVTLTAKANRPVKRGWMYLDGGREVTGEVVGEAKNSLRFTLVLAESGSYRLGFVPADGEPSEPTDAYPIKVLVDHAPRPEITAPVEEQVTRPANGQLEVNGVVGDDFGVKTVALRMKLLGEVEVPLKGKIYREGTSFRRETDGSYPTTLEYKDSVKLGELRDAQDKEIQFQPGAVIEYWLEAEDNCEPNANVGRSAKRRLLIGPAEQKADALQQQQQQRQNEEQAHRKQQDEKFKTENRDPQQPKANEQPQPQPGQQPEKGTETAPAPGGTEAQPQPGGMGDPGAKPPEGPKPPDPGGMPKGTDTQPMTTPPNPPTGTEATTTPMQPQPPQGGANDRNFEEKLRQAKEELERQERQAGAARQQDPEGPKPEAPPADQKGGTPSGDEAAPKTGQPDGMAQPSAGSKDAGKVEDRPPQSEQKAPPKPDTKQEPGQPSGEATGGSKDAPVGGQPAAERPNGDPTPQDMRKQPEPGREPGETKGNPEPTRGSERAGTPQSGAGQQNPEERPADARGQKPPDPASTKGAPPESGDPMKGAPESKPGQPGGAGTPEQEPTASKGGAGDQKQAAKEWPRNNGEPGELHREQGERNGEQVQEPKNSDLDRLSRDLNQKAQDLASPDQAKRQQAEKEFEDKLSKKDKDRLQQAAQDLKSDDPATKAQAQKDIDQLSKKAAQNQQAQQPSKEEVEKWKQKAQDLASDDPATRQQAEKDFDNAVGQGKREQIQQAMKDLKSGDPQKQQAAKEQMEKMAGQGASAEKRQPTEEELQKWRDKANDLNSPDPEKRQQAEKDFDDAIGKEKRQELQNALKDKQPGDPKAEKTAQQMSKDAAKDEKLQGQPPSKEEIEKAQQLARDLNSDDPEKRKQAEQAVDQAIGEKERKQLQQNLKDAQSPDPKTQQAAKDRLEDQTKRLAEQHAQNAPKPTEEDLKRAQELMRDLNSDDPKKREAAEKALDQAIGQKDREQLQKDLKDAQSPDPKVREAAEKKFAEQAKKLAEQQAKDGQKPTKEQIEQAQKLARDLASQDKETREKAEKEFDKQFGEQARKEAQQLAQDLQSGDPKKAEEAKQKLEEMAKQMEKLRDWQPGNPSAVGGREGTPHKDDPRNRLKTAELTLVELEKKKYDEEFKKTLGYTDEEYAKFLEAVRQRRDQLREEVAKIDNLPPGAEPPQGPATINVNQGATKTEKKGDGVSTTAATTPGTAPPGYSDAHKKFAEEAAKLRRDKDKK